MKSDASLAILMQSNRPKAGRNTMTSFAINGPKAVQNLSPTTWKAISSKASPDAKRAFWLKATIFKDGTKARAEVGRLQPITANLLRNTPQSNTRCR